MENQKSAIKPSLTYGLLLGIALIVYSLIMYLLDIDLESKIQWIAYLIIAGGIFWAMISFRDKLSGGFITYGKAFGVGFWTGLFAAVVSAIFTYIYVTMIDPGMIEEILLKAEDEILEGNPNMSDEQLEQALSIAEMFTSPIMIAVWGFLASVSFATISSLIIAIFVKREDTIEIVEEEVIEE